MQRNHAGNWEDVLTVDFSAESLRKNEIKQSIMRQIYQQQDTAPTGGIDNEPAIRAGITQAVESDDRFTAMVPAPAPVSADHPQIIQFNKQMEEQPYMNKNMNLNTSREVDTGLEGNKKQKKRTKRSFVTALAACFVIVISITAFAVVNQINLGQYAHYLLDVNEVADETVLMEEPILEELRGQLYDADGKVIEKNGDMQKGFFNAEGKAVTPSIDEAGNLFVMTKDESDAKRKQVSTLFSDWEEAQTYLAFEPKLFAYIPEGYTLEGYRVFNNEQGLPEQNTKYLEQHFYKDGNQEDSIYVQARFMDEETAFESSGSSETLEKTVINGYEAILDNRGLDILIDDVMYFISGTVLPQDEAIKMAESLTK